VPQTASYALQAASSSFAISSSYSDSTITASYAVSFQIGGALTEYATVNTSIVGSNNLFTKQTGSYTSGFYKYTVFSGSNARAGEVFAVWNRGNVQFTDISTNDLGTTATVTASVVIINAEAQFNIQTNDSAWRIKSTVTYL
jgi:hypothetical protein